MVPVIKHATQTSKPNDPLYDISATAWNEGHTIEDLSIAISKLDQSTQNLITGALQSITGTSLDNVFTSSGLLKRTGTATYGIDTSTYLTANQSITISGDIGGTGTIAITATLPNVNTNVGTYNNITINAKGLATAGSNISYLTSFTETDPVYSAWDKDYADLTGKPDLTLKADLVNGTVPSSQLPSYVDDVVEYANYAALPVTGETSKIYVTLDDNLTYRWSGTAYTEISKSLALGETSATAYRGDRGKTAYDHSQVAGGDSVHVSITENTNWDTAYSWGSHAGIYLGINAKAADSDLLDGHDTSYFQIAGNYITLASLSGTTPITYNNGTGAIGLTQTSIANLNSALSTGFLKITTGTGLLSSDTNTYLTSGGTAVDSDKLDEQHGSYYQTALGFTPANSSITISAGTGMSGGGDLTTSRTLTCTITQYTDALARAALSETITGIEYASTTGVFSLTSGYVIPSTTEETNWNTAYGWGNHASAGYLIAAQTDGMDLTLGTCTDGSYTSGISGFTTATIITDAIDTLDETLAYLAPADAGSLTGDLTMSGTTKYTGYLSAGNTNYKTGEGAGTSVTYIINDPTFTLTSPSTTTAYNKADEGYTKWYKAVGTAAYGSASDSVDHATNFQEAYRASTQVNTPWTTGQVSVTSVAWYNSFPKWQKGNATITITAAQLSQGYNKVKMTREGSFTTQYTSDYEVFYDNDAGANPSVTTPTVAENTPSYAYRSGVKYYGSGSTFNISVVGSDCFDNTYVLNPIVLTASSGSWFSSTNVPWNDATVSGLSNPPAIGETMTVTSKVITTVASQRSTNARVVATPSDPFGSYTVGTSASANRLAEGYANTASGTSSDIAEYYDDEWYRMLSNFNIESTSYSSAGAGGWDSTISLVSGTAGYDGLETYNGTIKYPVSNYSSGYLPSSGQPNYSAASGSRVYVRYFYVGAGIQTFTWTISGTTASFVSVATGPSGNNLTFEMLAPATTKDSGNNTVWKDCYIAYTSDTAVGCYTSGTQSSSTTNWVTTLGTKSTSTSGNVICVRITSAAAWTGSLSTLSVIAS